MVRNSAPRALHSAYTASMSLTRILKETADPVGIVGRLQGDRRLVVGRASAGIDDDPAVGESNIDRLSGKDHPAAEYFGIEAPK
jgi:hypothetical protein